MGVILTLSMWGVGVEEGTHPNLSLVERGGEEGGSQ